MLSPKSCPRSDMAGSGQVSSVLRRRFSLSSPVLRVAQCDPQMCAFWPHNRNHPVCSLPSLCPNLAFLPAEMGMAFPLLPWSPLASLPGRAPRCGRRRL